MPPRRCYRCWLAAASGGACWLLALSVASAQMDFRSGSLLDVSSPDRPPDGAALSQPVEMLAPTPGESIVGDQALAQPAAGWIAPPAATPDFIYHVGGKARGYYINDQRIEFTGMESTFAVEGALDAGALQHVGDWDFSLESQFFVNQPFDRNKLLGDPLRTSFAANFDVDPLQISQLYLGARNGDFYTALGRFITPFGRFYFPNFRNNFDDSPFIRSEAILFRETGLLVQWDPGIWVFTAALTNGNFQQDTNSSKALVARAGIDEAWYAVGASVKWQDGNGSEWQKTFKNHVGIDAMIRRGAWTLSGEAIYDQYGLRRPGTPLDNIFWGRSLYFRDLNNGLNNPLNGFGYYLNLGYEGPLWSLMLNYGEFYPQHIGDPRQDATTRRGIVKTSRHWTRHFETYAVVLGENSLHDAFLHKSRDGMYLILGGQFTF